MGFRWTRQKLQTTSWRCKTFDVSRAAGNCLVSRTGGDPWYSFSQATPWSPGQGGIAKRLCLPVREEMPCALKSITSLFHPLMSIIAALKTNHPDIPQLKLICMPPFKPIDGSMHNSPCLHSKQPSTLGDLCSSRGGPRKNRGYKRAHIRHSHEWLQLGLWDTLQQHGSPTGCSRRPAALSQGGGGGGRGWCLGGSGGRG